MGTAYRHWGKQHFGAWEWESVTPDSAEVSPPSNVKCPSDLHARCLGRQAAATTLQGGLQTRLILQEYSDKKKGKG